MSRNVSNSKRVDVVYEKQPYKVTSWGRTSNGDKVRVETWDDGTVTGWNGSEGRPSTDQENQEVMEQNRRS